MRQVDLPNAAVRDHPYIYTREPAGELSFDIAVALPRGEYYHYVRAKQKDGSVAWSSPVWVKHRPAASNRTIPDLTSAPIPTIRQL